MVTWHGHMKAPSQLAGRPGWGPGVKCGLGEQPRWVQMPTTTRYSGLRERYSFLANGGVKPGRSELGSARYGSFFFRSLSCSGVRCRTHTGLPRQATVCITPGPMEVTSTSTGAPAALSPSDGATEPPDGTTVATPAQT